MSAPKISVCLPVHNGERFLPEAIETVLNQSFQDFELLISDDCSQDRSCEIIEKYASKDSRVKRINAGKHLGLFENYNFCIKSSTAPLIKFMAQDDTLENDALDTIYGAFSQHPQLSLLTTRKKLIDQNGEPLNSVKILSAADYFPESCRQPLDGVEISKQILSTGENFIGEPVTVTVHRRALQDGFDPSFSHVGDIEYWLRILMNGSFLHIDKTLCAFRMHESSQSRQNRNSLFSCSDTLRLIRKHEALSRSLKINKEEQMIRIISGIAGQIFFDNEESPKLLELLRSQEELQKILSNGTKAGSDFESQESNLDGKLINELLLFRELSYHALLTLGRKQNQYKVKQKESAEIMLREQQITYLECELRQLLNSISWRSTRSLRELNARFFGLAAEQHELGRKDENEEDNLELIANRQKSYMNYLSKMRSSILESRSWKVTAPLRFLAKSSGQ